MGVQLLTVEPPKARSKDTYTQLFWEAYPAYIAMGMPSDEYWNGDAQACVAYRKARDEMLKMQDIMAWRSGLYTYHALCCAAPLFCIKPQKPEEYIKPFGFGEKEVEKKNANEGLAYVKAWADRVNKMRREKNGK